MNNDPKTDTNTQEANPSKVVEVYTEDPFAYNYVALNKSKVDSLPVPPMEVVKSDLLYYRVGKSLGIEDPHDWNKLYQQVFTIAEWAKERVGTSDPERIVDWIGKASKYTPDMGSKKIKDIYNHIRMAIEKGKNL
jgi:hypothetical protein